MLVSNIVLLYASDIFPSVHSLCLANPLFLISYSSGDASLIPFHENLIIYNIYTKTMIMKMEKYANELCSQYKIHFALVVDHAMF